MHSRPVQTQTLNVNGSSLWGSVPVVAQFQTRRPERRPIWKAALVAGCACLAGYAWWGPLPPPQPAPSPAPVKIAQAPTPAAPAPTGPSAGAERRLDQGWSAYSRGDYRGAAQQARLALQAVRADQGSPEQLAQAASLLELAVRGQAIPAPQPLAVQAPTTSGQNAPAQEATAQPAPRPLPVANYPHASGQSPRIRVSTMSVPPLTYVQYTPPGVPNLPPGLRIPNAPPVPDMTAYANCDPAEEGLYRRSTSSIPQAHPQSRMAQWRARESILAQERASRI